MSKIFRKKQFQLFSAKKVRNYLFYTIREITLVVIGILITITVNNWNEDRKAERFNAQLLKRVQHC